MSENKIKSAEEMLKEKLHAAIDDMIEKNGGELKRCTYYHSGATFVETKYGGFMIRIEPYKPSEITLG